jgi:hypothetical protein
MQPPLLAVRFYLLVLPRKIPGRSPRSFWEMVEKILRRSRDPRKIPRKTVPNTQTYEGTWIAIYPHYSTSTSY